MQVTDMENEPDYRHVLTLISQCDDIEKLNSFLINAQRKNVSEVINAAQARIKRIIPKSKAGTIDKAFWKMFDAYDALLTAHAKPNVKLYKARSRAVQMGVVPAVEFWVQNGAQAWAFQQLVAHKKTALTAEHIAIDFPKLFGRNVVDIAKARLFAAQSF